MLSNETMPVIVIVDDDALIRDALAMVLEDQGCRCLQASNGAAGLQLLRELTVPPSLIVLDLTMPIMNGWEFRAAQLADERLARIPTIVLTAAGNVRSSGVDLGSVQIIRKPVDLRILLDTIREYVAFDGQAGDTSAYRSG